MYCHVITKFSRMGSLLYFLTHGAPLARFARESSAIKATPKWPIGNGVVSLENRGGPLKVAPKSIYL